MADVHLILTGIMTIQRFDLRETSSVWRIVIPSGLQPAHRAHIMVESGRVKTDASVQQGTFTSQKNGSLSLSIIDLDQNVVWIDGSQPSVDSSAQLSTEILPIRNLGTEGKLKGLANVSHAAVLRLDRGDVAVTWIDRAKTWDIGPLREVSIADEICVHFTSPAPVLRLKVGTSQNGSIDDSALIAERSIEVSPDPAGRIEVRIANILPSEVLPSEPKPPTPATPHHPLHYVSMARPTRPPTPPAFTKRAPGGGGSDEANHRHRLTLIPDDLHSRTAEARLLRPAGSDCPPGGADPEP